MQHESQVAGRSPQRMNRTLTHIRLERFTAFEHLDLDLNAGINVFMGANGTGKTHLLKVAYAACECTRMKPDSMTEVSVHEKLVQIFLPSRGRYWTADKASKGRPVRQHRGAPRGPQGSAYRYSTTVQRFASLDDVGWSNSIIASVFIPAKEMLSHAPGFRSLYAYREIQFEEIYADIIDRSYLPPLRGRLDDTRARILRDLENAIGGTVAVENEEFFLKMEDRQLEFTLLAEGMRKLGLLWLLIRNGTLGNGAVLFWDEPEANLNPKLLTVVVDALLHLQRSGVQVLIATHEYAILKELELLKKEDDDLRFHALYRDSNGAVSCESANRPFQLAHSAIAEAFTSLYDREIERSLGGGGR